MAIKNQTQLEQQAQVIRDEVASKANTSNRVGEMIIDFIQSIYDSAATDSDITDAINLLKDNVPIDGDTLNKLYLAIQDLQSKIVPPVAKNYADEASMIADRGVLPQVQGAIYSVGSSPNITYYEYLGTANGDITDYSDIGGTAKDFTINVGDIKIDNTKLGYNGLPLTGDLTVDDANSFESGVAKVLHNDSFEPAINVGAGITLTKIGEYIPDVDNEIIFTCVKDNGGNVTRVNYQIINSI